MRDVQIWRHDALYDACERRRLQADVWETQPGGDCVWVVDTAYGEGGLFDAFLVWKTSLATLLAQAEQQERDPDDLWDEIMKMSMMMEAVTAPWGRWEEDVTD
jgi:hypothetical protein